MSRTEAAQEPSGELTSAAWRTILERLSHVARPALVERQLRANDQTRESWTSFAAQRQQVTQLIREQIQGRLAQCSHTPALRVAILGAGNANDLDLEELTSIGRSPVESGNRTGQVQLQVSGEASELTVRLHLFDLDEVAIGSIRQRQPQADWSAISCHAPIDLSGLEEIATDEISRAVASERIAERMRTLSDQVDFDIVVSTCLLSQIIEAVVTELGGWRDDYLPLVQQLRTEHLRLLSHCTRSGGTIIFITDFVSSDSCDALHQIAPRELPELVQQLIAKRNFFTGLNPAVLAQFWSSDAMVSPRVERVRITQPWLWNPGPRLYVVCGFVVSLVANRC